MEYSVCSNLLRQLAKCNHHRNTTYRDHLFARLSQVHQGVFNVLIKEFLQSRSFFINGFLLLRVADLFLNHFLNPRLHITLHCVRSYRQSNSSWKYFIFGGSIGNFEEGGNRTVSKMSDDVFYLDILTYKVSNTTRNQYQAQAKGIRLLCSFMKINLFSLVAGPTNGKLISGPSLFP